MSVPLRAAAAFRVAAARLVRASTTGGANSRRRGERGRERNDTLALLAFRPMKHILTVVEQDLEKVNLRSHLLAGSAVEF